MVLFYKKNNNTNPLKNTLIVLLNYNCKQLILSKPPPSRIKEKKKNIGNGKSGKRENKVNKARIHGESKKKKRKNKKNRYDTCFYTYLGLNSSLQHNTEILLFIFAILLVGWLVGTMKGTSFIVLSYIKKKNKM